VGEGSCTKMKKRQERLWACDVTQHWGVEMLKTASHAGGGENAEYLTCGVSGVLRHGRNWSLEEGNRGKHVLI
jgi:hypothetical protein